MDVLNHGHQIDYCLADLISSHPRELEQVVDQGSHGARCGSHFVEVAAALLVQSLLARLNQKRQEPVHMTKRGAKIVRNGIAEGLQLPVANLQGLEGSRALHHPSHKFLVELADFVFSALALLILFLE